MTTGGQLIERYITAYNAAEWADLGALVSADYVHHSGPTDLDLEGFRSGAAWIRRGIPDFTLEIEDQFAVGDRVAVRFTGSGSHTGSFGGETPSGRTITVFGTTIFRIAADRIAEDWEATDEQPFRTLLAEA